jgi:hypothetical protein
MKIISKLAILIFSLWSFFSWAICPSGYVDLYCRGGSGFSLQNYGWSEGTPSTKIMGTFKRNQLTFQQGNQNGIKAGSCTWFDLIIGGVEFNFNIKTGNMSNLAGLTLLNQCAPSNKCWFNVCAQNTNGGPITLLPDFITIHYE